jgi:putative FmdB family regulatory protein
MPTYEYRCKGCGEHLEVVQSFTDDPLTVCPACNGTLRKVFGSIGITFKGSGFYRTDSRSGTAAKAPAGGETKVDAASKDSPGSSDSSSSGSKDAGSSSSGSKDSGGSGPSAPAASKPAAAKSA